MADEIHCEAMNECKTLDWAPPAEEVDPSPFTRVERHWMDKSRVYMLLFALGGYLVAGLFCLQVVVHLYELVTWDAQQYDELGLTSGRLEMVAASRAACAAAIGALSYALWNWAVSMRAAYCGTCDRREMSARQLSFFRAAGATALVLVVHAWATSNYSGSMWQNSHGEFVAPLEETTEETDQKYWTASEENLRWTHDPA
jgi:hypothetical protein